MDYNQKPNVCRGFLLSASDVKDSDDSLSLEIVTLWQAMGLK